VYYCARSPYDYALYWYF
nr:immunoglobulin heavy chain junction region [Mus musculus]